MFEPYMFDSDLGPQADHPPGLSHPHTEPPDLPPPGPGVLARTNAAHYSQWPFPAHKGPSKPITPLPRCNHPRRGLLKRERPSWAS